MRKHAGFALMLCLLLALVVATPAGAQPAAYTSPQAALYAFFDAISLHDYPSAWQIWYTPPASLDTFRAGYLTTQYVLPYFGPLSPDASPAAARIPALLVSVQTDNTVQAYLGCYSMINAGAGWRISSGSFAQFAAVAPDAATVSLLLSYPCGGQPGAITTVPAIDPLATTVLRQYFASINLRAYDAAYAMWLQPLPGPQPNGGPPADYRRPYGTFASGYRDTVYINVYPGPYQYLGASAGKPYLDGLQPVVLVSQQADGRFQSWAGCFVMGYKPDGTMGIVNGRLWLLQQDAALWPAIASARSMDCSALGIPS